MVVGSVTGTGSALTVELGFSPDYVKVYNDADAAGLAPTLEWWAGMADGSALKSLSIADNGTTARKSTEKITANGISAFAGDDTTGAGFTIGADTDVNASGETIYYVAVGGE
ncbi:MAG: hypothetical protein D6688_10240 [Alphaproteobacteria bacterium]|nr:MAG: hypothetical protein D6688_10240 [Alphaproteobacteria bacterium]